MHSTSRRLLALSLCLFALGGCKKPPTVTNEAPTADAGADQTVTVGDAVTLLGTGTDPEGAELTFSWRIASAPTGSAATLQSADLPEASFAPDVEGDFVLELVVNDGELDSAADAVTVTAEKAQFISGSVTVTVVDHDTGAPIAGASVVVGDPSLTGTTDANGVAVIEDASLEGAQTITVIASETVSVDHDLDSATANIDRPRYRTTTLQGAIRAELTIPLRPTTSARRVADAGIVEGRFAFDLFDRLPNILPFASLDSTDVTSEQLRALLIAPAIPGPISELRVGDLLGPPVSDDAVLPGNLATDDEFLQTLAPQLGVPVDTGDDYPLTKFRVQAPAGTTRFFVLGALIGVDTATLVPVLSGGVADPGAILGSLELQVLFVGIIDLEVTAGGVVTLPADLSVSDLSRLAVVPADVTTETGTGVWALDATVNVDFERAVITPKAVSTVTAPPRLADPRLAANLPATWDVEIFNADGSEKSPREFQTLTVPDDTGVPVTDLPYALVVNFASSDAGWIPWGIGFARGPGVEKAALAFGVPDLASPMFRDSVHESMALSARGLVVGGPDRAYARLPGGFLARQEITTVDGTTTPPEPTALPTLDAPMEDAGLRVSLTLERSDLTSTTIDSASANMVGQWAPVSGTHDLVLDMPVTPGPAGELAVATLALRIFATLPLSGGGTRTTAVDDALWDIYADAESLTTLTIPETHWTGAPFTTGDELTVELRTEAYPSALDMARWSGERLRAGPKAVATDLYRTRAP